MVALRFPGSMFHHGEYQDVTFSHPDGFNGNGGGVALGADLDVWVPGEASQLYLAPSRYSEVRKVVFWVALRHEQTGGQAAYGTRLRIGTMSTNPSVRVIDSVTISPSSVQRTQGGGTIWTSNTVDIAHIYGLPNTFNTAIMDQIAALADNGVSCILFCEFNRFEAGASSDFFDDWDTIAAAGQEDKYVSYRLALERDDASAWNVAATGSVDRFPMIAGAGYAVVQAPSGNNKSCTAYGCNRPLQIGAALSTAYGIPYPNGFFPWRASEWDGVTGIYAMMRTTTSSALNNGGVIEYRLDAIGVNTFASTQRGAVELLSDPASGNTNWLYRTRNLLSDLVDGDDLVLNYRATSGGTRDRPFCSWEIIQEACTKKVVFLPAGIGHQADGADIDLAEEVGRDAGLFDPLWFQGIPDEFFFAENIHAAHQHNAASNNDTQRGFINADLGSNPDGSSFNQDLAPETSSTPVNDPGHRLKYTQILANNPLNLAGKRLLSTRFFGTWTAGTDSVPGNHGLAYNHFVPPTEVTELGPLFELGAFDPEGCASTAAGLGDNPGVLVITNGSTIPKKFNPDASRITDAGIPPPFREEEPSAVTFSTAASVTGGLVPGIYTYRYTFRNSCTRKESDPNPVDIVVDASGESPAARVELSFAGVQIPADLQIDEIGIYRTVIGGAFPVMALVGFLDLSAGTVFTDELNDAQLDFLNDGLSLLNGPMPCVPVVSEFRNRLFGLGDIPNLSPAGTVTVVAESDLIAGDTDTLFDRCLLGKFIQIKGDCNRYEILELLAGAAGSPTEGLRLKVDPPYEGTSDTGLQFTICGRPNRVYISEPLEAECWPAANFLDVEPGDGDRLIGAVSNFNSLIICKRRKTYRIGFRLQPATEIVVPTRISSDIGCVAPRSFAQVASGSVWLAERGLALYDGRSVHAVPESSVMNDLFVNPDNPRYLRRDSNGRVIGAIGVFYPRREQYLLLLPTVQTQRGANLMLVWDTELRNVTLYEFCQEFLSMEVAKDADGNERVYLGDANGFVWIFDVGDTDGAGFPNSTGTVRGLVSSAGVESTTGASILEDTSASFVVGGVPELGGLSGVAGLSGLSGDSQMGLAGACLFTRAKGAGVNEPWKVRTIFASTRTRLYVTPSWGPDVPAPEDDYMIAPIEFDAIFKPSNRGTDDFLKRNWRHVVAYEPELVASKLRVELLNDFEQSDPISGQPVPGESREFRVFDLSHPAGRQIEPVERDLHNYLQVRLRNFAPEEPVRVLNHLVMLNPRTSK